MLRRIVRDPRNLPLAIAVAAALMVVPEIPSPVARPTDGWRGWYVLLYRAAAAPAVEAVLPAVAPGSVSRAAATVRIDAFSEIETLPVAALEARLDPLDPRRDAWLSGVHGYFSARDGDTELLAAYLPSTRGRIATWLRLARAFDAGGVERDSWQLLELGPLAMLSAPAAALCFALVLAWRLQRDTRRSLLPAAAGVLVWLPALLNGGSPDLFLCCTALYFWMPRALQRAPDARTRHASRKAGATGVRIGVLLCIATAVVAAGDAAVYRVGRMSASLLSLGLLTELAWSRHLLTPVSPRATGRFEPVPIRIPRRRPSLAPFAAFLAATLIATVPALASRLQLPLPRVVSLARAGSRSGIEAAARTKDADRLPGLADAVGHAASLQTLALGAGAEPVSPLPPHDGRVLLREYTRGAAAGSLVETPRTVARFDPGWLGRLMGGFPTGTVERLLVDQCRVVEVCCRASWTTLLQAVPAALACIFLLAASAAGEAARRLLIRLGLSAHTDPARSRRTR